MRLRRRLPFVALAVAATAILSVFLRHPAVPVAGGLAVLLLVLSARPNPPAGSMAMALPVPLLGDPGADDDATEVAWA